MQNKLFSIKRPYATPTLMVYGDALQITQANAVKLPGSWDDQSGNNNSPNPGQCPKSEFNFSTGQCYIHP